MVGPELQVSEALLTQLETGDGAAAASGADAPSGASLAGARTVVVPLDSYYQDANATGAGAGDNGTAGAQTAFVGGGPARSTGGRVARAPWTLTWLTAAAVAVGLLAGS